MSVHCYCCPSRHKHHKTDFLSKGITESNFVHYPPVTGWLQEIVSASNVNIVSPKKNKVGVNWLGPSLLLAIVSVLIDKEASVNLSYVGFESIANISLYNIQSSNVQGLSSFESRMDQDLTAFTSRSFSPNKSTSSINVRRVSLESPVSFLLCSSPHRVSRSSRQDWRSLSAALREASVLLCTRPEFRTFKEVMSAGKVG